jgi:hypothetical protein
MFTTQALTILTLVATAGIASAQQKPSNPPPRVTDAERQAAVSAVASQGASIAAINAKMPLDRSEPAFGKEFANIAREEAELLEKRMIEIDESFERARWNLPRRFELLPTQPSSIPAPEQILVQPATTSGGKKAPKAGEAPCQKNCDAQPQTQSR